MVFVAGGLGLVVVPVVTSISNVTTVEHLGAALGGTGDEAVIVVPVVGPTFDCSLSHFRVQFEQGLTRGWSWRRRR